MPPNKALPLDFGTGADPQYLRTIPLDAIHTDSDFTVRRLDAEALDDLARSLEIVGQLQPIGVRAAGANWNLVYGERRVRAARLLNWSTLLARVYPPVGAAAVVLRATENMHRQEFSLEDGADTVLRLVDAGMSPQAIAKALARTEGWVVGMLSIARDPLARDLVRLGRLQSVSAWEAFIALDAAEQRAVLDSPEIITVNRCNQARQDARQKEERRQKHIAIRAAKIERNGAEAAEDCPHPVRERAEACAAVDDDAQWVMQVAPEIAGPEMEALTLHLDRPRYRALEQLCVQEDRSAQDILTEALDALIERRKQEAGHV